MRRFAKGWSQNRGAVTAEAYVPLYYAPGEAYQFDWSHEVVVEDPMRCGLCTPQLEVIARMQANFGIEPIVVTVDGAFHPLYPDAVMDTGQLRHLGLADHPRPFVALVELQSGTVEPIGSGLLTEDVIFERVHVVTQVPVGQRY